MNRSETVAIILKKNPQAFDPTRIHRPSEYIKNMIRVNEENPQYNNTTERYFFALTTQAKKRDSVIKEFIKTYLTYFHNIGTLEKNKKLSLPYSSERKNIIKQINYENNYLNINKDKFDEIFKKEKLESKEYVKGFNNNDFYLF